MSDLRDKFSKEELASAIDHTELHTDATYKSIEKLCLEAMKYEFGQVCVGPCNVELVAETLQGSDVKIVATIGFFTGTYPIDLKVSEAKDALSKGADEIDYVINIGAVKSGDLDHIREEMSSIKEAAGDNIVKSIIETYILTDEEKRKVCEIAKEVGLDFVKTSTGFREGGATVEDVRLMKETVGDACGVKAAGGMHTTEEALAMMDAGASRLGVSAGVPIIRGY